MLSATYSKQFDRDVKKAVKRGKNLDKLKHVIGLLVREELLEERYKNHPLKGNYKDCYGCHIEPDWVLIYRIEVGSIQLVRTGSHSDLFR